MKKTSVLLLIIALWGYTAIPAQNFEGKKEINGAGIFCKVEGSGEPLIIVHSGPGLAHNYLYNSFQHLASNYRLIFYDQIGNGLSDDFKPGKKYTMDDLVEELEGVRKAFGVEKFNLVGQSWGALIAINYASKYSDRIKKMLLPEPAPGSSSYLPEFQKNIISRFSKSELEEISALNKNPKIKTDPDTYRKYMNLWFKSYYFDKFRQDLDKFNYFDTTLVRKKFASSAMFDHYLMNFDVYDKMKSITLPVLIIHGDYDVIPTSAMKKMKESFPNAELHIIKDSGHFVHIEKKDEYFSLIKKFIGGK